MVRETRISKDALIYPLFFDEGDNILDKYIKQHRDEIEAGKFETQKLRIMEELAQQKEALIQETIKQLKSQSQAKENTANVTSPSAQPDSGAGWEPARTA